MFRYLLCDRDTFCHGNSWGMVDEERRAGGEANPIIRAFPHRLNMRVKGAVKPPSDGSAT